MKEKKKSAISWILTWAGQKRIAYVWSVLLAIGNVIFKILPYFIIADIVKLFLNGEKEFEIYLAKAVLIALSFIIAELLHSLSTALSHKATFAVLANIRKSCCDKLARVPLGYVKDTPSGTFKKYYGGKNRQYRDNTGAYCPGIHVQSAGTDCDFDLFLPDRLETGTLVIGAGYSGISFLFWNDAGL